MGVQKDWLMRLQAHALIVACLAVQYSSMLFPGGYWIACVLVGSGLGSLLRPKEDRLSSYSSSFQSSMRAQRGLGCKIFHGIKFIKEL